VKRYRRIRQPITAGKPLGPPGGGRDDDPGGEARLLDETRHCDELAADADREERIDRISYFDRDRM
jgi:hypothetical protein